MIAQPTKSSMIDLKSKKQALQKPITIQKSQFNPSVLTSLLKQAEYFDFAIFQQLTNYENNVDDDLSQFNVFQRFCLFLLILNGGQERSQEETKQFLKQLHVYREIKNIDLRIRENFNKIDLDKLKELTRPNSSTNQLQRFVNTAVEYADTLNKQENAKQSST